MSSFPLTCSAGLSTTFLTFLYSYFVVPREDSDSAVPLPFLLSFSMLIMSSTSFVPHLPLPLPSLPLLYLPSVRVCVTGWLGSGVLRWLPRFRRREEA